MKTIQYQLTNNYKEYLKLKLVTEINLKKLISIINDNKLLHKSIDFELIATKLLNIKILNLTLFN